METATVSIVAPLDFTATTITNTTTESEIVRQMFPSTSLQKLRGIGFRLVLMLSTTPVVAPTLTINVKFGGQSMTVVSSATGLGLSAKTFIVEGSIANKSTTNSQSVWAEIRQGAAGLFNALSSNVTVSSASGWAVDTTTAQTFSVTAQFSAANTANVLTVVASRITVT